MALCRGDLIPCRDSCTYIVIHWCLSANITYILHFYILNVFITSIISLTQTRVLLVIKCCHAQRCTVSSLPLLLFCELMKLNVLYATAHLKATGDSCRKMKKKKVLFESEALNFSLYYPVFCVPSSSFPNSFSFISFFLTATSFYLPSSCLFFLQFLTSTLSLSFQHLLISFFLNLFPFPFPPYVCLSVS